MENKVVNDAVKTSGWGWSAGKIVLSIPLVPIAVAGLVLVGLGLCAYVGISYFAARLKAGDDQPNEVILSDYEQQRIKEQKDIKEFVKGYFAKGGTYENTHREGKYPDGFFESFETKGDMEIS
ncbi:MAG: hypothetical protein DGJ47_001130 [Rickettsiaceae bacterium]